MLPSNTWPHDHNRLNNCFSRCITSPWESERARQFPAERETRLSLAPHHRAVALTPPLHPGNWAQQTGAAGGPQEQTGVPLNLGTHRRVSKPIRSLNWNSYYIKADFFRTTVAYKLNNNLDVSLPAVLCSVLPGLWVWGEGLDLALAADEEDEEELGRAAWGEPDPWADPLIGKRSPGDNREEPELAGEPATGVGRALRGDFFPSEPKWLIKQNRKIKIINNTNNISTRNWGR